MSNTVYPKISSPWKRFTEGIFKNRFNLNEWTSPEIELLWHEWRWTFTEKLDGTNVRVEWDGYNITFLGRTDKAQMPTDLLSHLKEAFSEELLEQEFGNTEVVLYGEGVGPKIQKNGDRYFPEPTFVLFDVRIGKWWLQYDSITEIASALSIPVVPHIVTMPNGFAAENDVRSGLISTYGDFHAEGVVGTAPLGLLDRSGNRIQVKLKHKDLFEGEEK